ncbi:MAG: MBG domain-containing protein [Sphingomonas bacterium]
MKHSSNGKWLSTTVLGSGALLLLASLSDTAWADDLPAGGVVATGAATIGSNGQTTTINQSSSRAVINWDSFSVSQGKTVAFVQPDAQSATLNRVTGSTSSTIAGQILSNGAVYLINPNGIAITKSGTVQTGGGFVASTLAMADADFMVGKTRFTGTGASGSVSNAGHITAGQGAYVALLGGSVSNSGTIAVPLGRVGLGSGESITLDLNGDGFMQVAVPTSALTGDKALISHSGSISASGGFVVLEAATVKDAIRNVINLSGDISADSATGSAGNIRLFGGDGGTVTVSGTLSAQAMGATGNGGLVETSGASVNFAGLKVNTSSAHGTTGTWLIDPTDLTVDAAAASTISTNLATSNVTLQTNADGTTSGLGNTSIGNGDINVNATISWYSRNALSFSAYHDVNINAGIVGGESASLNIRADNTGTGNGSLYLGGSSYITNHPSPIGGSAFRIAIFYNPVSYNNPTDFSNHISTNSGIPPVAYMLVNNVNDLQNMNLNMTGTYALGKDIDASSTASWNAGAGFVPIGTDGLGTILNNYRGFVGRFEGGGHTISGLTIVRPTIDGVGLFGIAGDGGDFRNFHIVNANITGHSYVGGVIGSAEFIGLGNISFSGSVTGSANDGNFVGGIGGYLTSYNSRVGYLRSSGTVKGFQFVGGVVGVSASYISDSSSSSDVLGNTSVGGFAGEISATAENIFATGNVTGHSAVGGLIGQFHESLRNAYSTGTVKTDIFGSNVGGLIGYVSNAILSNVYSTSDIIAPNNQYVGGIAGYDYQADLINGYYAGVISAPNSLYVGALAGSLEGSFTSYTHAYWDIVRANVGQAFGTNYSSAVSTTAGLSTSQLQNFNSYAAVYTGWDFAGTWAPPTQAGQAGQTSGYYPQLYALTPVVVASAADATRTYGAVNPNFSVSITAGGPYNGYVFGPGGDALSTQALLSGALTQGAAVGQYVILGNSATSNGGVTYRVIDATGGKLSITPAALTITYNADPFSRLYGSANPALTGTQSAAGLVNGDTLTGVTTGSASYATAATSASNVGSYAINGGGLSANSGNYSFTFAQAAGNATALTINPAALTITYAADPFSRLYGAANPAFTGAQSATGLVNGDTLAGVVAGAASYSSTATVGSNIGSYAINGGGLTANSGNYNFTFAQAAGNATALTINPASLTVVADPLSRTYGATNPALTYVSTGLVNGDALSGALATTATSASSVGIYGITQGSLAASSNYALSFTGASLTINPAALTVTYTADPFSRLYGAANPAFTGTQNSSGLVNGDTLAGVTTGTASYSSTATSGSNAGSYAINGSGLSANSGNYSFTFAQAVGNATALTVNPAPLTITYTADPFSRIYGTANPALTGTQSVTGLVNGDTLSGVTTGITTYATSTNATSNVGTYAINGSGLGANSGNYSFTFAQAAGNATAFTINPASLTVVADPLSRTYGANNPALTYAATGLVNGDTLSGALATNATSASSVGVYGITQGSLAASANYALSFTGASLTINPAALTITYSGDPFSRAYGAANPLFTGMQSANGLVNGDTLAGITTGSASYGTIATSGSNVGSYAINGSGLAANSGNYDFTFAQAAGNATALTINPAALTITYAADPFSRLYGAANPAFTGTQRAAGLVNGDTLAGVTAGSAGYASAATTGSNVGSYAINGSGLTANSGNYSFTFAQAAGNATALTINPAALAITYTADPFARLYGATNPTFSGTQAAAGLVNGDTLAGVTTGVVSYGTTTTAGSNIGSYAINGSGLAANSGNYSFTFVQAASNATALTINPAALAVIANPLARRYGANNPALTYAATGLVNGDTLSGALATTATTASSVGTYGITQGSLAASSNYVLSFTGALLTINPATLTITYTADPFSRLYGNANPALTGTQSAAGLVNGDTLAGVTTGAAGYATTATTGSNIGSYAINGSGLAANSGNYSFTFAQAAGNATALKITPRPLSVAADPISRQFGLPNPPLTYVISPTNATSGLVNGDVLTGALSTTATQSSPSGDYTILQGSLAASANYIFSYTGALLKIALPPVKSLSSFVPTPALDQAQLIQPDPSKGCTNGQVSEQIRETGKAAVGNTGETSCN